MKIAVCSGSFDPITLGHLDIITRAAQRCQVLKVCVSPNAQKTNQMFTPEEKLALVQQAVAHLPNVEAELFEGLLADYAIQCGADTIVRGVRNGTDFDAEMQLFAINQSIHPKLDTWFVPASGRYGHISSSMAREMIRYHQNLAQCMPESILPMIEKICNKTEG